MLPDGRIVYSASLRGSGDREGRVALVGVNADGTDDQLYAGAEGLRVKRMPTPTASGLVVFAEASDDAGDGSGRLASVSQRRPLHSHRVIGGAADDLYHSPSPLPDGRLLVSWRDRRGEGSYGVYRLDPATGARERVFDDPAWDDLQAKLVGPRALPDARSSVVRDDDAEGKLYTIDVYIQEPGRELPRGAARRLRVVEGVPATAERPVTRRLLGEVGIAEDGSYQVQVPANTPVELQLLDASGAPLADLGLALGQEPRGTGLRRVSRGPGTGASEPPDEGAGGPGPRPRPAGREAPPARPVGRRRRPAVSRSAARRQPSSCSRPARSVSRSRRGRVRRPDSPSSPTSPSRPASRSGTASATTSSSNIVEGTGAGACFFDYNSDGWLGHLLRHRRAGTRRVSDNAGRDLQRQAVATRLYRNNGDGTFTDVTEQAGVGGGKGFGVGCSAADYDNDGYVDLYVLNYGPNTSTTTTATAPSPT